MIKLLHFADAHIDMATHGKHDPETGLPVRVLDFLKALDTIVDTAISEKVDLVIFAGDAYKDRTPAPTFQREWGKRIMRLSEAAIPTILLVGNHDLSPATGRAHTLQEFATLQVPHIHVIDKPMFLKPADLEGLPLQVLGLPWIFRSGLMANLELSGTNPNKLNQEMEDRLASIIDNWLDQLDPHLPTILTAHGSVQGADFGNERAIMLGRDLILPNKELFDKRINYVALGHIHKYQNLNKDNQPPIIYPGSIEKVDFGEYGDKGFILANIEKGATIYEFRHLNGRPFYNIKIPSKGNKEVFNTIYSSFSSGTKEFSEIKNEIFVNICKVINKETKNTGIANSMIRLVIEYPRDMEPLIDDKAIREYCSEALEFHFIRHPLDESRARLPVNASITGMGPLALLHEYWQTVYKKPIEYQTLNDLAASIIETAASGIPSKEA